MFADRAEQMGMLASECPAQSFPASRAGVYANQEFAVISVNTESNRRPE
jgi:hypothetical protein